MKQVLIIFAFLFTIQLPATVFGQSKTAHVDTRILMDTLPSRKKAMTEIQEVTKRGEAELSEMDKNLQKSYEAYMAAKQNQSEQINQYEEGKIQQLQQDIQKREQELNTLIQKMTIAMNDNTYKVVQQAVKSVANKKGYQYVLEEATTIYAGGTSITNDVIPELIRLDEISMK